MMVKRKNFLRSIGIWVSFIFLFCSSSAVAVDVSSDQDTLLSIIEISASVDKSETPLNEKLTYTVELSWEGEQERYKVEMAKALPLENLELTGSVSINQKKLIERKVKSFKTYKFFLKPLHKGEGKIDEVEFKYVDTQTNDTLSLFTQPVTVKIAPPVLKEEKNPLPYLIIILVLFFLIITFFVLRRREKEENKEGEDKKEKSLEEKAKSDLSSLRDFLDKKEIDAFFQNLHLILTNYIEHKYRIYVKGKSSNNIFNSLLNLDLDKTKLALFKEILTKCDLYKYADFKFTKKDFEELLKLFEKILEQK